MNHSPLLQLAQPGSSRPFPRRGEVFDLWRGPRNLSISGRLVVVVSPDELNAFHGAVTILPLHIATGQHPCHVICRIDDTLWQVHCEEIHHMRSILLGRPVCRLTPDDLAQVLDVLRAMFAAT